MFVERKVVRIRPGQWAELEALCEEFDVVESRLGLPAKRYLRCYVGGHDNNTLVLEREWESLAALEEVYMKALEDPEWLALGAQLEAIAESSQVELYLTPGEGLESKFFAPAGVNLN